MGMGQRGSGGPIGVKLLPLGNMFQFYFEFVHHLLGVPRLRSVSN
jgi:hypothetical protein